MLRLIIFISLCVAAFDFEKVRGQSSYALNDSALLFKKPTHGTAATSDDCGLESDGESAVVAVHGPQTLQLADGRFVRLADVLLPTTGSSLQFDPSGGALSFLQKTLLGKRVEIKFSGLQRDRYGISIAHVFVKSPALVWLQAELVERGWAQVYPQSYSKCAQVLFKLETKARDRKAGHWGSAFFKVSNANDSKRLWNVAQTYQIIEGTIADTTERSNRLSLSFEGEDHRRRFFVAAEGQAKEMLKNIQARRSLIGSKIRVRGWIEKRGTNIFISASQSQQIEFVNIIESKTLRESTDGQGPRP